MAALLASTCSFVEIQARRPVVQGVDRPHARARGALDRHGIAVFVGGIDDELGAGAVFHAELFLDHPEVGHDRLHKFSLSDCADTVVVDDEAILLFIQERICHSAYSPSLNDMQARRYTANSFFQDKTNALNESLMLARWLC